MTALVARRIAMIPLVLLGVTLLTQLLYLLLPGDPAVTLAGGENASISEIERIRAELGFDDPFLVQYWNWLVSALHFDFGNSLVTGQSVGEELVRRLPATLSLGIVAFAIAIPLGLLCGAFAAVHRGRTFDRLLLAATSAGMAVPAFIIAIVLILFFGIELGLFPTTGFSRISEGFGDWLSHVVLPATAIAIAPAARIARTLRSSLVQSLDGPYILTAWSKGASARSVLGGHALKNSLIPTITILGIQVDVLVGGSLVVENVFSVPGVGSYVAGAATTADIPVIQACTVLFAVVTVVANLVVDLAYGLLNPKVRVA